MPEPKTANGVNSAERKGTSFVAFGRLVLFAAKASYQFTKVSIIPTFASDESVNQVAISQFTPAAATEGSFAIASGCGAALTFGTAKLCFSMEKWRFAKSAVLPIGLRAAYSFAVAAKSDTLRRIAAGRIAEGINTTLGRRNHKNRPEIKISDVLQRPREDHDEQRPTQHPDQAI